MKIVLGLAAGALLFTLLSTGVTPVAPAGIALAKKCSVSKCRDNCAGKGRNCAAQCGACDKH